MDISVIDLLNALEKMSTEDIKSLPDRQIYMLLDAFVEDEYRCNLDFYSRFLASSDAKKLLLDIKRKNEEQKQQNNPRDESSSP